jgi:RHS repeat-associated protein
LNRAKEIAGHPLEAWADQAYRDGITSGCTSTPVRNFCPSNAITRAEIVILLLKAKNGASYSPSAATHTIFADMNGNWAEAWAEAAYNQGITSGCSTNPRNFCPNSSVTRDMNAVLLNTTFQLASAQLASIAFSYSGTWHKYYFAGTSRIAMRTCSNTGGTNCTAPTYFLSDHLGSTSVSVNNVGTMVSTMLYSPWGTVRYSSGTMSTPYQYEGQFSNMSDFGLLFFNARWVDPVIGRFTSPDSIIPPGVQGLDRYGYVNNNPLRYTDPTGHICNESGSNCESIDGKSSADRAKYVMRILEKTYNINIKGSWDYSEIMVLNSSLEKMAELAGGTSNLQDVFHDALENNESSVDKITFFNGTKEEGIAQCGTERACWNRDTGTIVMSDYHFKEEYQKSTLHIPGQYLPQDLEVYVQKSILHEMSHVFTDARPASTTVYGWQVDNSAAFGNSAYESSANAIALYILTGGNYYGFQDQMNFVDAIRPLWNITP